VKRKRFSVEQIVAVLKQAEVGIAFARSTVGMLHRKLDPEVIMPRPCAPG